MSALTRTFAALDPSDSSGLKTRVVGLEEQQLNSMLKANHGIRLARLLVAKAVCENPEWVFEGLQRPDHDWSHCYAGNPGFDFRNIGVQVPPPRGMVFVVFITPRGKLTDWAWEPVDEDGTRLPEKYRTRFGRMVWPTIQTFSQSGPGEVLASESSAPMRNMDPKKTP